MSRHTSDLRYLKKHRAARWLVESIYMRCLRRLFWPHLIEQRHGHLKGRSFGSILLIRHNMLGDAVVSSVLIQALRSLYPNAHISVLASPYNKEAFTWIPGVDDILVWPGDLALQRALVTQIKGRFELVLQTLFDENYINRMLVARTIAGEGVLIGRARRSPVQGLMDHAIELPMGSYASKLLALLAPLTDKSLEDLVADHPRYVLRLPEKDKAAARDALAQAGVHEPFVLLNISARESFRALGDDQAVEVARGLVAAGHTVVISCAPGERHRARTLSAQVPGTVVCEHSTLGAAMAAVEQARIYVGPDTGTVHFAATFGIPCVILFAATARPDIWSAYGTSFISLQAAQGQAVSELPPDTIVDCALELLTPSAHPIQRIQQGGPLFFSPPPRESAHLESSSGTKSVKRIAVES